MKANKVPKTYSMDRDLLTELKRTKGPHSESERVNRLLRQALEEEHRAELERDAAQFYASQPDEEKERRAFRSASLRSWARD